MRVLAFLFVLFQMNFALADCQKLNPSAAKVAAKCDMSEKVAEIMSKMVGGSAKCNPHAVTSELYGNILNKCEPRLVALKKKCEPKGIGSKSSKMFAMSGKGVRGGDMQSKGGNVAEDTLGNYQNEIKGYADKCDSEFQNVVVSCVAALKENISIVNRKCNPQQATGIRESFKKAIAARIKGGKGPFCQSFKNLAYMRVAEAHHMCQRKVSSQHKKNSGKIMGRSYSQ